MLGIVLLALVALAAPPGARGLDSGTKSVVVEDDGFAFAIHATGDYGGNYIPCG